jgi:hypothetical protein
MKVPGFPAIVGLLLTAALLADAALLVKRQSLLREVLRLPVSRIWFPRSESIPTGYLANGLTYGPDATRANCFAVLYTSANCGYCSAQRPMWSKVVRRADKLGCDALRVAPERNAEVLPVAGQGLGRELVFLRPGWAGGSPPTITPTLIIFARDAPTAWCRVGALDEASTRAAMSALVAAAAEGFDRPAAPAHESTGRLICR